MKNLLRGKKIAEPDKTDTERYLADPLDQTALDEEFDILAWWKLNAPKYPDLARVAKDVLAVPASTVASEAAFSTSGRTLSAVRNRLKPETLEAFMCAQDWLKTDVIGNFFTSS